jgi:P27 family predicted phage terminase small subunit
VLEKRGAWRAKTREGEPVPTGEPVAPAWLSERAAALWSDVMPGLIGIGVATSVDSNALARYVTMLDHWLTCVEFVRANGMTFEDPESGTLKEFPQVSRLSRLADQLLKLEQQYGMTASARASMTIQTGKTNKESDGIGSILNPKLRLA